MLSNNFFFEFNVIIYTSESSVEISKVNHVLNIES